MPSSSTTQKSRKRRMASRNLKKLNQKKATSQKEPSRPTIFDSQPSKKCQQCNKEIDKGHIDHVAEHLMELKKIFRFSCDGCDFETFSSVAINCHATGEHQNKKLIVDKTIRIYDELSKMANECFGTKLDCKSEIQKHEARESDSGRNSRSGQVYGDDAADESSDSKDEEDMEVDEEPESEGVDDVAEENEEIDKKEPQEAQEERDALSDKGSDAASNKQEPEKRREIRDPRRCLIGGQAYPWSRLALGNEEPVVENPGTPEQVSIGEEEPEEDREEEWEDEDEDAVNEHRAAQVAQAAFINGLQRIHANLAPARYLLPYNNQPANLVLRPLDRQAPILNLPEYPRFYGEVPPLPYFNIMPRVQSPYVPNPPIQRFPNLVNAVEPQPRVLNNNLHNPEVYAPQPAPVNVPNPAIEQFPNLANVLEPQPPVLNNNLRNPEVYAPQPAPVNVPNPPIQQVPNLANVGELQPGVLNNNLQNPEIYEPLPAPVNVPNPQNQQFPNLADFGELQPPVVNNNIQNPEVYAPIPAPVNVPNPPIQQFPNLADFGGLPPPVLNNNIRNPELYAPSPAPVNVPIPPVQRFPNLANIGEPQPPSLNNNLQIPEVYAPSPAPVNIPNPPVQQFPNLADFGELQPPVLNNNIRNPEVYAPSPAPVNVPIPPVQRFPNLANIGEPQPPSLNNNLQIPEVYAPSPAPVNDAALSSLADSILGFLNQQRQQLQQYALPQQVVQNPAPFANLQLPSVLSPPTVPPPSFDHVYAVNRDQDQNGEQANRIGINGNGNEIRRQDVPSSLNAGLEDSEEDTKFFLQHRIQHTMTTEQLVASIQAVGRKLGYSEEIIEKIVRIFNENDIDGNTLFQRDENLVELYRACNVSYGLKGKISRILKKMGCSQVNDV